MADNDCCFYKVHYFNPIIWVCWKLIVTQMGMGGLQTGLGEPKMGLDMFKIILGGPEIGLRLG